MNRLVLRARLVERGALRDTPAGLPALDLMLQHESSVEEAGRPRKVALQLRAVAIGDVALDAAKLPVGGEAEFDGFVAAQRNGRGLVFHVNTLVT